MVPEVGLLYLGLNTEVVKRYNKLLNRQTTTDLDANLFSHVLRLSGRGNCYKFWCLEDFCLTASKNSVLYNTNFYGVQLEMKRYFHSKNKKKPKTFFE